MNADWVLLEPVESDYCPTLLGEASHTVLLGNLANRVRPIIRYDLGDSIICQFGAMCLRQSTTRDPSRGKAGRCAFDARPGWGLVRLLPLAPLRER